MSWHIVQLYRKNILTMIWPAPEYTCSFRGILEQAIVQSGGKRKHLRIFSSWIEEQIQCWKVKEKVAAGLLHPSLPPHCLVGNPNIAAGSGCEPPTQPSAAICRGWLLTCTVRCCNKQNSSATSGEEGASNPTQCCKPNKIAKCRTGVLGRELQPQ